MVTAKKKNQYSGCLAQAVIGMFTASLPTNANPNVHIIMLSSVDANRDQLSCKHFKGREDGGKGGMFGGRGLNRWRCSLTTEKEEKVVGDTYHTLLTRSKSYQL